MSVYIYEWFRCQMTNDFQNFLVPNFVLAGGEASSRMPTGFESAVESEVVGEPAREVKNPSLISLCDRPVSVVNFPITGVEDDLVNDVDDLMDRRAICLNRFKGLILEVVVVGTG